MTRLLLMGVLLSGLSGIAVSQNVDGSAHHWIDKDHDRDGKGHGKGGDSLPEPSQAFALTAAALLTGSALVIRRRGKKSQSI